MIESNKLLIVCRCTHRFQALLRQFGFLSPLPAFPLARIEHCRKLHGNKGGRISLAV